MSTTKPIKDKTDLETIKNYYLDKKEYRNYTLIIIGLNTALRISDILSLTWKDVYHYKKNQFHNHIYLTEKKTGKRRIIKVNADFRKHILDCYNALRISDMSEHCFLSKKKVVFTIQRVNVRLKEIKSKYNLKIEHFSTHSMRKTFGRRVVESAGENTEMALIKLSELFNHSTPQITRRYLGLRQEELMEVYDTLIF